MSRNGSLSSLARLMYSGMRATVPISFNISSTPSLAPPCTGPHRQAMPAEMQAYGLAPDDPARRTVAVDALWLAERHKYCLGYCPLGRHSHQLGRTSLASGHLLDRAVGRTNS